MTVALVIQTINPVLITDSIKHCKWSSVACVLITDCYQAILIHSE